MIELDVIAYLNNDTTLKSLLGATGSDTKIYPTQSPAGVAAPYIVINTQAIGSLEENIEEVSLSVNCVDDSISLAKTIRDRVIFLLDRQDEIQDLITSTEYRVLWAKNTGGSVFNEEGMENFHHVAIFDFKYIELSRRYIDVMNKFLTLPVQGIWVDEKILLPKFYFPASVTIKDVWLHADVAPDGANITIDIMKDDVELSLTATLTDGERDERTDITDTNFLSTEKFGIKIKSVGTTFPGEGGFIQVRYQ